VGKPIVVTRFTVARTLFANALRAAAARSPSYYPFRFFDDVTGKWTRARYVAELHVIAERHEKWEDTGAHEIRSGDPTMFNRFRRPTAHLPPVEKPPPDRDPPEREPPDNEPPDPPVEEPPAAIKDGLERFLVLLFLRRYVTYCARRRRFAQMNGAARLYAELIAKA
jgi:hypothetical protein